MTEIPEAGKHRRQLWGRRNTNGARVRGAEPELGYTWCCHVKELQLIRCFFFFLNLIYGGIEWFAGTPAPFIGPMCRSACPQQHLLHGGGGSLPCSKQVPRCCPCFQGLPSRLFPLHPLTKNNIYTASTLILQEQAPRIGSLQLWQIILFLFCLV